MTVKLIALYRKPADEAAFLAHYYDVHLPLVAATPHLAKTVINRVTGSPMGEPPYFLIAEMHFPDRARFDEAMASPENRAAGKDLMSFAREIVTLLVAEEA
ncbi:ethyl tert-butyl ether degradation protein EthD [Sphingomonas sp. Root710]|nr:ethyl tert-butyl ether degradation protein EthD [Sphingomonas sp. Root710]